jgi:hypothetical protein
MTRPASKVAYVEFGKLIDAIRLWADYGGAVATGQLKPADEDEDDGEDAQEDEFGDDEDEQSQEEAAAMMTVGLVLPQVHQFFDFTSALRSVSSVTYQEDDVWVTHGEIHIQDLE